MHDDDDHGNGHEWYSKTLSLESLTTRTLDSFFFFTRDATVLPKTDTLPPWSISCLYDDYTLYGVFWHFVREKKKWTDDTKRGTIMTRNDDVYHNIHTYIPTLHFMKSLTSLSSLNLHLLFFFLHEVPGYSRMQREDQHFSISPSGLTFCVWKVSSPFCALLFFVHLMRDFQLPRQGRREMDQSLFSRAFLRRRRPEEHSIRFQLRLLDSTTTVKFSLSEDVPFVTILVREQGNLSIARSLKEVRREKGSVPENICSTKVFSTKGDNSQQIKSFERQEMLR